MLQLRDPIELSGYEMARPTPQREPRYLALERLVCAALCNSELADALVNNPEPALRKYEVGRSLSEPERRLVLSVGQAEDIYEFAGILLAKLQQSNDNHRAPVDDQPLELPRVERATRELRAAPDAAALVM